MKILNLLFKKAGKLVNLTDDAAKIATKNLDDISSMSKSIFTQADDAGMVAGRYLRAQKPRKVVIQSYPTQQYLDDMLGVATTQRASQVTKDGVGLVNRKACADAQYAFTKGTKIQPVTTTSTPTAEAINKMHNVEHVDALRRAEVTGELPASTLAKRKDVLQAVEGYNGEYFGSARIARSFNQPLDGGTKVARDLSKIDITKLNQISSDAQALFAKADKILKL